MLKDKKVRSRFLVDKDVIIPKGGKQKYKFKFLKFSAFGKGSKK